MTIKSRIATQPIAADWSNMPLMLNEKETAIIIGVSLSFLRKARCEGQTGNRTSAPPFVRVGQNTIRYRASDVRAWVENLVPQQVI
ncbi:hypothetical protein AGMMS49957_01710 [Synergistales bacterium]|nr:hypothetical protein AGMMS49957_01710 [Synergistales bacterium]